MKTSPLYALTLNSFLSPEERLVFETNIDIILAEFPDLSLFEQNLALSLAGQYVSEYQARCRVNRLELEVERGCEAVRLKNQESLHLAIRDLEKAQNNIQRNRKELINNRAKSLDLKVKIDALTNEEGRAKILSGKLNEIGAGFERTSEVANKTIDSYISLKNSICNAEETLPKLDIVFSSCCHALAEGLKRNPKIIKNTLKSAFVNFYNQHKTEESLREAAGKYNSKTFKEILDLVANCKKEKTLYPTVTIRNIIEVLQLKSQGHEGIKIGLFSESCHGAKVAFETLEKFIDNGDGADYVKHDFPKWGQCRGNPSKGTDRWTLHTNNSTVTALPLSDKTRGYRFDVIILVGEISEKNYQEIILPMSRMMSSSPLFPVSILFLKD